MKYLLTMSIAKEYEKQSKTQKWNIIYLVHKQGYGFKSSKQSEKFRN